MVWNYRLGKKGECYYVYEYITSSCVPEVKLSHLTNKFKLDKRRKKQVYACMVCKEEMKKDEERFCGNSWTEDPIVDHCYESKADAIKDLKMMLKDIENTEPFEYK